MGTFKDLSGQKFNKLTVINIAKPLIKKSGKNEIRWLCICECGNKTEALAYNLKNGNTKSCGCHKLKVLLARSITHGMSHHALFNVFSMMKRRCYVKNDNSYKNYGGRGISICQKWLNNPSSFFTWALTNGYEKGLQIDRINNDGNYEPCNCHFVTQAENARNKQLIQSNNTSGYRGVYFYQKRQSKYKKWSALVCGKTVGWFKTALEAAKARDKYAIDNNLGLPLNFPK